MGTRNRELETGSRLSLVALVVVGCFAGIPPLVDGVTSAVVNARTDAPPMRFVCRSCGHVEDVREVTLGAAKSGVSTISGEGLAMVIALLTGKLGAPVNVREISVRLQDGTLRVFHEGIASAWRPGDRVKVSMGRIKSAA